jgi:putative transposase
MARKPRIDAEDTIHHVHARGNNRQAIYLDEIDRDRYLELLALVAARYRWNCLAYCLMTNHVHLLIETAEPNLGDGMRDLHGKYARFFNERHGRVGHLFQRRYGSTLITDERHFLTALAYIVANPVAARLCSRPESWKWSSHRATLTRTKLPWLATDRLLEILATAAGNPVAGYLDTVEWKLEGLD